MNRLLAARPASLFVASLFVASRFVASLVVARASCVAFAAFVAVVVLGPVASACAPWSAVGEPCTDAPCAPGLVCSDGVCAAPPEPPAPPCSVDDECAVDGDAAGRVCADGVCGWAACGFDVQCGTRVCVDGTCAPAVVCAQDLDCGSYPLDVCDGGVCRPACFDDAACGPSLGGLGLQTCVDGHCEQRCLNDATCLGQGICQNGACVDPQCTVDDDCDGDDVFCDGGRCTAYTPCALDDDCFDPNLFCDVEATPVRCAERATCRADAECGASALCVDGHCRPAETCFADDDCADADDECVAQRCVRRPACRADDDCGAGQVCAGLACVAAPTTAVPAQVAVADGLGACDATRPCTRALFVGEVVTFSAQGFDADGLAVTSAIAVTGDDVAGAVVDGDDVVVTAAQAGAGRVQVGDVVVAVAVVAPSAPLAVLVQHASGAPASGVRVDVGGVVVITGDDGVASFDPAPPGASAIVALRTGDAGAPGRGVVLVDDVDARIAAGGRVRLVLADAPSSTEAAPLLASVQTTGDETGPVGLGVVLPALDGAERASVQTLFGGVAQGQVTLPVIGAIPIALPSSFTLSASLPLSGDQQVRPLAEVAPAAGPSFVFALEDRRQQQDLVQFALAGDPFALALDVAEQSEGLDAAVVPLGNLDALPLVADEADRDNDGDTAELVPDYDQGPTINTVPSLPPRERVGVRCQPPAGSGARALVVTGLDLPGRFVVNGTGVVRGARGFEDVPLAESLKAVPPTANLAHARRALAVHAFYADDALASRAVVRARKLAADVDIGALLDPPEGAFVLADLPAPGDRSVVLPALPEVTHVRVEASAIVDLDVPGGDRVVVDVWSPVTGALRLPSSLQDVLLRSVQAFVVDVDPFAAGHGAVDVDRVATKAARAPGG